MKLRPLLTPLLGLALAACQTTRPDRPQVIIETPEGNITLELFDDTPIHSNNFLALADSGLYDGTLFHRVIRDFMIQGGDPDSRNAESGKLLGSTDIGEPLEAEFRFPEHYHLRGALAMAREPDDVNPERRSSGSQFYIVWGKTHDDKQLDYIEQNRNERILQQEVNALYRADSARFAALESSNDPQALLLAMDSLRALAKEDIARRGLHFSFPDSIREAYKEVGGTPWLDNEYTVFGRVVDGLDVVERISNSKTDANDRPLKDIAIKVKVIR